MDNVQLPSIRDGFLAECIPLTTQLPSIASTRATLFALVFCIVFASFWATSQQIFVLWNRWDGVHGGGWLILAATVWLASNNRRRFFVNTTQGPATFVIPMTCCLVIWAIGWASESSTLPTLALPATVFFAYCTLTSLPAALSASPILILLGFALPIWWELRGLLQGLASTVVSAVYKVLNLSIFRDGNVLQVSGGTFEVAEGCSGLNFLLVSLFFATYLGFSSRMSLSRWCLLIAGAALLGLTANWLRIFVIVYIGDVTQMQHPIVNEHALFGWLIFGLAIVPFLLWQSARLPVAVTPGLPFSFRLPTKLSGIKDALRQFKPYSARLLLIGSLCLFFNVLVYQRGSYEGSETADRIVYETPLWRMSLPKGAQIVDSSYDCAEGQLHQFSVAQSEYTWFDVTDRRLRVELASDLLVEQQRELAIAGGTANVMLVSLDAERAAVISTYFEQGDRRTHSRLLAKSWLVAHRLLGIDRVALGIQTMVCSENCQLRLFGELMAGVRDELPYCQPQQNLYGLEE